MIGGLLICVAMTGRGRADENPIPADAWPDRTACESARKTAGHDPDAQVRLALWCESHGLGAERMKHLSLAVLSQDTRTGNLSFTPVVAVYHNNPAATLRIRLGDEPIVVTGIHRFWRAGKGWTMARELKPGDAVRMLGGTALVASVEDDSVQPVFNLEVAEGRSFFVGGLGVLVHDNSLVQPEPDPFDAVSAPTAPLTSGR